MKPRKYRNVPTEVDGIRFDSRKEARRYSELKLLERAGEISDLVLQPEFFIRIADRQVKFPNGRRMKFTADFAYTAKDGAHVEDVKSSASKTQAYAIRKALVKHIYGIEVEEV